LPTEASQNIYSKFNKLPPGVYERPKGLSLSSHQKNKRFCFVSPTASLGLHTIISIFIFPFLCQQLTKIEENEERRLDLDL
jgi:hypothetical protein